VLRRSRTRSFARRGVVVLLAAAFLVAGCSGGVGAVVEDEPILRASIPGTRGGSIDLDGDRATRLLDVIGDWNAVSVNIAELAIDEGWTIEAINCVGTGNDVIARKNAGGTWLLLEAGAGTRGAGVIVSVPRDQRAPRSLGESGRCPQALREAAGTR
jgi:hypothetical protein